MPKKNPAPATITLKPVVPTKSVGRDENNNIISVPFTTKEYANHIIECYNSLAAEWDEPLICLMVLNDTPNPKVYVTSKVFGSTNEWTPIDLSSHESVLNYFVQHHDLYKLVRINCDYGTFMTVVK